MIKLQIAEVDLELGIELLRALRIPQTNHSYGHSNNIIISYEFRDTAESKDFHFKMVWQLYPIKDGNCILLGMPSFVCCYLLGVEIQLPQGVETTEKIMVPDFCPI